MNSNQTRREYLKKLSSGVIAGVTASMLPAHAEPPPEASTPPEIENLDALDEKSLNAIVDDIYHQRDAVMQPLVRQLTSSDSTQDAKINAAILLGEYRIVRASGDRVDNITLHETDTSKLNNYAIRLYTEFPAQTALCIIGSECVPDVIDGLATQNDLLGRYLLLEVLGRIYRYPECVKIVLQHAISEERDVARKTKLRETLASFLKPPPIEKLRKLLERHPSTPAPREEP